jgi:gamma-glutamylcysteine synthetase
VDSLIEMANTGVTGSDEMLEKYVNKWGMNIDKIYDEYVF